MAWRVPVWLAALVSNAAASFPSVGGVTMAVAIAALSALRLLVGLACNGLGARISEVREVAFSTPHAKRAIGTGWPG